MIPFNCLINSLSTYSSPSWQTYGRWANNEIPPLYRTRTFVERECVGRYVIMHTNSVFYLHCIHICFITGSHFTVLQSHSMNKQKSESKCYFPTIPSALMIEALKHWQQAPNSRFNFSNELPWKLKISHKSVAQNMITDALFVFIRAFNLSFGRMF